MLLTIGDLYEEVLVRPEVPLVRGRDVAARSFRCRGGSAANVAAIDAELGGSPRFVGQVGDDATGHALVAALQELGVESRVRHAGRTGTIVSLLDSSRRTRLVDRGAARGLAVIDSDVLDGASQLYLAADAFVDDPLATAVDRLLGDVRDERVPVTLGGPSTADLSTFGVDGFLALVMAVAPDSIVLDRDEQAALGIAPRARVPGATHTIVTAGPLPTVVIDRHGGARSVEVRPVEIRDRTGVGDGFVAGYLRSRRSGADAFAAVDAGHRTASMVLEHLGPTIRDPA